MSMFYNKLPRGEEEKYIKLIGQTPPQIIEDPLLNFNYEPPIQLLVRDIATKIQEQQEDKVMEVVHSYNINVDKEELIKALQYDRDQYIKGYTDAVKQMERQGEWIRRENKSPTQTEAYCSMCGRDVVYQVIDNKWAFENYCPHCGAEMKGE